MNVSTSTLFTIFVSLYAYGAVTSRTTLAFAPIISSSKKHQRFLATASPVKKGTQLNYFREQVETEAVGIDNPMEEAFDNMQHPMELMLLARACIPYVAENRIAENKATMVMESLKPNENDDKKDSYVDPMEEAFDNNMQHPMELMLLARACILYVAENRIAENKATMESLKNPNENDDMKKDTSYVDDPMEDAFDNIMQHPMELLLLSRACIPYVAM